MFPKLKTNAVAQYPATKSMQFRNEIVRFLDGKEQRYRNSPGALHRWTIRLEQLDESEMANVEQFFQDSGGRLARFSFSDPWDGAVYDNCSLSSDEIQLTSLQEMSGNTSLTIVENRG